LKRDQKKIEKHGWDEWESEPGEKVFSQSCHHRKIRVFFIDRVFVPTFIKPFLIIIAANLDSVSGLPTCVSAD
jgi:hypothetical protein